MRAVSSQAPRGGGVEWCWKARPRQRDWAALRRARASAADVTAKRGKRPSPSEAERRQAPLHFWDVANAHRAVRVAPVKAGAGAVEQQQGRVSRVQPKPQEWVLLTPAAKEEEVRSLVVEV